MDALHEISRELVLIFSVHPRTRQQLEASNTNHQGSRVRMLDPLSYIDFLALQRSAKLVITDSGGIQEETTYLGVPCLTVRENTERPVTVAVGTNILIGKDMRRLKTEAARILGGSQKRGEIPPLWDGHAADRIAEAIIRSEHGMSKRQTSETRHDLR